MKCSAFVLWNARFAFGRPLVDSTCILNVGLDCLVMVCIELNMLELNWLIFVGLWA